jgi:dTDP-4-amino-4,6-dideoxygalactose transaminase
VDDFDPRKGHAAWLFSIMVERRWDCQLKLRGERIESGQIHYRNDRYSVFNCKEEFPGMDSIDDKYLCLPLHTKMATADVDRICDVLKAGW